MGTRNATDLCACGSGGGREVGVLQESKRAIEVMCGGHTNVGQDTHATKSTLTHCEGWWMWKTAKNGHYLSFFNLLFHFFSLSQGDRHVKMKKYAQGSKPHISASACACWRSSSTPSPQPIYLVVNNSIPPAQLLLCLCIPSSYESVQDCPRRHLLAAGPLQAAFPMGVGSDHLISFHGRPLSSFHVYVLVGWIQEGA